MKVKAETLPRGPHGEVELPGGATGADLLEALALQPDAHVLFREGVPIPLDEPLRSGDDLKIVLVVSGGA